MSNGAVKTKTSKWIIGSLIVSLAVNLFLGGFLLTRMRQPDPFSIFPKIAVHRLLRSLPEGQRDQVKEIMEARKPRLHEQFDAMRQAQGHLQQVLKAETLDRTELNTAFDGLRSARSAMEHTLQGAFVEILTILPPEQRREMSMSWYRPDRDSHHNRRHHKKYHGEDGGR